MLRCYGVYTPHWLKTCPLLPPVFTLPYLTSSLRFRPVEPFLHGQLSQSCGGIVPSDTSKAAPPPLWSTMGTPHPGNGLFKLLPIKIDTLFGTNGYYWNQNPVIAVSIFSFPVSSEAFLLESNGFLIRTVE